MQRVRLEDYQEQDAKELIDKIPFFRKLKQQSTEQYELLLSYTAVTLLEPGEAFIKKGTLDTTFYTVLKGRLDVYADEIVGEPIGRVLAGQVLGGLSLINRRPRTASLQASVRGGAVLLATDFSLFGSLLDFSRVGFLTKISLYQAIVTYTYWKLDEYRHHHNNALLNEGLSGLKDFTGTKGSVEELQHLAERALGLGELLGQWNKAV
jgi:hypothetical protein